MNNRDRLLFLVEFLITCTIIYGVIYIMYGVIATGLKP
jgi:hypothetical protein